ncbi:hypothetical protein SAMN05428948_1260 [Massilia sp. CF038]|nr:hypothetical protein SAMN05428948_1260 [Massilia sp. CF038]
MYASFARVVADIAVFCEFTDSVKFSVRVRNSLAKSAKFLLERPPLHVRACFDSAAQTLYFHIRARSAVHAMPRRSHKSRKTSCHGTELGNSMTDPFRNPRNGPYRQARSGRYLLRAKQTIPSPSRQIFCDGPSIVAFQKPFPARGSVPSQMIPEKEIELPVPSSSCQCPRISLVCLPGSLTFRE